MKGGAESNIGQRGCRLGESWTMEKLDANPARKHGPLGATTASYWMFHKSSGCEIAAAPTADGGALAMLATRAMLPTRLTSFYLLV